MIQYEGKYFENKRCLDAYISAHPRKRAWLDRQQKAWAEKRNKMTQAEPGKEDRDWKREQAEREAFRSRPQNRWDRVPKVFRIPLILFLALYFIIPTVMIFRKL
mgnify:CR=1 FL=1